MANRERARDRGTRIAAKQLHRLANEARDARIRAGLTQRSVAASVWMDRSWVSRFERGRAAGISVDAVSRMLAVVGLDLTLPAYPSDQEVRDEGHARLIGRLVQILPVGIVPALEVPFPMPGDTRAWDLRLRVGARAWGVEAETHLHDLQATLRKLHLKARDGRVDGVVLLLGDTGHHRSIVRSHASLMRTEFPVQGQVALAELQEGRLPHGNAVILL
jgi:transcriptional regulator with XRE-family HTH domain